MLLVLQWSCFAVEHWLSPWAHGPRGLPCCCNLLDPRGFGLGFEARGFLFVCSRLFYSFIPNHIQFSLLLSLWLSAILK